MAATTSRCNSHKATIRPARLPTNLIDAASAPIELEFQQRLACSIPSRILVSYRYRDGRGAVHAGRRTVLAASPEGQCLWAGGRGLVAMYDPDQPDRSHLVSGDRFADS